MEHILSLGMKFLEVVYYVSVAGRSVFQNLKNQ
jgi:hypothetical protein